MLSVIVGSLYSCSWDHSLKRWDFERQDCVVTCNPGKVFTSIDIQQSSPDTIISSHPDGKIRLWDARSGGDAACRGAWGVESDRQWISQVRWHPTNEHIFVSGDYSGMLRIWDRRASSAAASIEQHDGKALCLAWMLNDDAKTPRVLSGGSDGFLKAMTVE